MQLLDFQLVPDDTLAYESRVHQEQPVACPLLRQGTAVEHDSVVLFEPDYRKFHFYAEMLLKIIFREALQISQFVCLLFLIM